MARFAAVVLPNLEASQSGVAATALGHGVPVIATPVGGVVEQIKDGETGLIAEAVSAEGVAGAMRRFLVDRELRHRLSRTVASAQGERSIGVFVNRITSLD
jgi:glycosyltransferase involved in cell wall biosynthesis